MDNKRICVFHGDDHQVHKLILESQLYDLYCTGHNHTYAIEQHDRTLLVNPGSLVGYFVEKGNLPINIVIYDTETSQTETVDLESIKT